MTKRRLAAVTLDADVRVPRRDGVALRADVYRPAGGGRHPALVLRLPYDKRLAQSYWYAPPSWYAERGFAVVVEDVRGRHRSPGAFVPLANEGADGADLLRWVAAQPWCDGSVGMYGYSYCGLVQLLAAGADGEVPLAAIAPALAPPGLGDGCLHVGGVPAASFAVGWAIELDALRLDTLPGGAMRLLDASALRDLVLATPGELLRGAADDATAAWLRHWLDLDPDDGYWRTPSHRPAYDRIGAHALHLGGLYDTFRSGTVDHYRRLRSAAATPRPSALGGEDPGDLSSAQARYPQAGAAEVPAGSDPRAPAAASAPSRADHLVLGPWTHQPVRSVGAAPSLARADPAAWQVDRLQLDFFDAVLRGGAPPAGPPVRIAVLNSGDAWTGVAWPPEPATPVRWYLTSRGRANGRDGDGLLTRDQPAPAPPDHLVFNHADPVPAFGGDDCGDPALVGMGPADQATVERRNDVLVYTSAPAARDRLFAGDAAATLFVDTADRISHWVARVCLVTAEGASVNLAEGVVRHDGGEAAGPWRVEVPIGPVAFRVGRGQRLRLHVTSGSAPRWGGVRDPDGRLAVSRSVVLHDPDHPACLTLREVR
jgi:putative CocE/NonD family hydrolase